MKRILKIAALLLVIITSSSLRNNIAAQSYQDPSYQTEDPTYQTFYDDLSPYGRWIDYPGYGYVWSPDAGSDFRPYSTNGHWVYTDDYQWMWVSDYDWGWATFHYGRWFNDADYGWLWVPGYEWAPAWVAWRSGGDYYGWAPLRPGITVGVDFSLDNYYAPDDYWCFAPRQYITSPRIYDYCVDRRQNFSILHTTVIINEFNRNRNVFVTGPRRSEAEAYCGTIRPFTFRASLRPGRSEFRNNEVSIYRPNIRRDDNRSFSPRQFDRFQRSSQNDGRISQNDNQFRRNNSGLERNDNTGNRNNGFQGQRNGNDRDVRQPSINNGNDQPRPRTFDRSNNNNIDRPFNNNNGVTGNRPTERPSFNQNNNNNNGNRNYDRHDDNNRQQRPIQSQPEQRRDVQQRPVQAQPEQRREVQPRQFDRRNDENRGQNNNGNSERTGGRRKG